MGTGNGKMTLLGSLLAVFVAIALAMAGWTASELNDLDRDKVSVREMDQVLNRLMTIEHKLDKALGLSDTYRYSR